MAWWNYPEPAVRQLSDSDRNIMWELRFEPCTSDDDCTNSHHFDSCPRNEE